MDTVSAGTGGGLHPGAPTIWPTIKPPPPTTQSEAQAEAQKSNASSQATQSATRTQQASTTASTSSPNFARSLSAQDLSVQLMNIGLADTPENQQLATKMLEFGLELSPENFSQLFKALQNKTTNQSSQNAAFTALSKGLATNQAAVKSLEQFFAENNNISEQLTRMQQSMSALGQALSGQKGLDSGLISSLASIMAEFDKNIKKMQNRSEAGGQYGLSEADLKELASMQSKMGKGSTPQISPESQKLMQKIMSGSMMSAKEIMNAMTALAEDGSINNDDQQTLQTMLQKMGGLDLSRGFLNDLAALRALIAGLQKKISQSGDPEEKASLLKLLGDLENKVSEVSDNMTAQAILSKLSKNSGQNMQEKYNYYIIPNPFSEKEKSIEILIKRDTNKKNAPVNPEKTQIIIKMETESMGEVAVIVEISGQDLWYLFSTDNEDARKYIAANSAMLREQMSVLDYRVQGFNSQVKKIEINKIVSPTIDLDSLRRIRAEA